MARRLELHEKFCELLGTRNVYFQPPASVKLKYPCFIYKVANRNDLKADDKRYRDYVRYEVTFITRDSDSEVPDEVLSTFRYVSHERNFTLDNLHHDIFTIFY